jgi:hypothetical protein
MEIIDTEPAQTASGPSPQPCASPEPAYTRAGARQHVVDCRALAVTADQPHRLLKASACHNAW